MGVQKVYLTTISFMNVIVRMDAITSVCCVTINVVQNYIIMMKMLSRFNFGNKISKQNKRRKLKENFIFVKSSMTAQTTVNKREYVHISIRIKLENGIKMDVKEIINILNSCKLEANAWEKLKKVNLNTKLDNVHATIKIILAIIGVQIAEVCVRKKSATMDYTKLSIETKNFLYMRLSNKPKRLKLVHKISNLYLQLVMHLFLQDAVVVVKPKGEVITI